MSKYMKNPFNNFLATDLDGTLVGNDQDCTNLFKYLKDKYENIGLAYVTGRHYSSACKLIVDKHLEPPDFLVTDVGTAIHFYKDGDIDEIWQKKMRHNWEPAKIKRAGVSIEGMQEQILPEDCRVSFTVSDDTAASLLQSALIQAGIPHTYVYSSNRDVDILPPGGGKGEALKYIVESFVSPAARILAAGDSGNDIEMLTAGFPSVIVANAQAELLAVPASSSVYKASGSFAGGILEGWRHFYD